MYCKIKCVLVGCFYILECHIPRKKDVYVYSKLVTKTTESNTKFKYQGV